MIIVISIVEELNLPEQYFCLSHSLRGQLQLEHLELHVAGIQMVLHSLVQPELGSEALVGVDAVPLGLDLLEGLLKVIAVLLHQVRDHDRRGTGLAPAKKKNSIHGFFCKDSRLE